MDIVCGFCLGFPWWSLPCPMLTKLGDRKAVRVGAGSHCW